MFVGHYSAALALKRVEKRASLGWLFLAAQLVDIVLFVLVLLGIERVNIVEGYTASTYFELEFIPFSHGLLSALVWAALAYAVARGLTARQGTNRGAVALVMAVAVFSYWVLDWIVHTPDLPITVDGSAKVGLGLWNNAPLAFAVETLLLLAGVWLYLRGTKATTAAGRYGMPVLAVVMIAVNAFNTVGPPLGSATLMAVVSLGTSLAFGAGAFWLDRQRS